MGDIAAELPKAKVHSPRLRTFGDDRLGRLASAGDASAFALVYERHHQALYRYCLSILSDPEDAADALQNTMAAAFRGLQGESRAIRLKPWLFRIAHNECIAMLRTRRPHVSIDESLELIAPGGDEPATRERLRQLVDDLRQLPDAQRGALVMRELSGLGYEEIAAVLGGTVAGARQTVFEARSALHELAEGRAMDCEPVRRALSDNDGRVLRGRKLRAHLGSCASCREFRDLIGARKSDLACLAPPLPAALAAGLLHHVIAGGAVSAAGGGAVTTGGGAGLGALAAGKALAASTAFKATAAIVATAAVAGGTVEAVHEVDSSHPAPARHAKPHRAHPRTPATATGVVSVKNTVPAVTTTPAATNAHAPAGISHGQRVRQHGVGHGRATTPPKEHSHGRADITHKHASAPAKQHTRHTPKQHERSKQQTTPKAHHTPAKTPTQLVPELPARSHQKAAPDHGTTGLRGVRVP